jgi:O-antigen ligase
MVKVQTEKILANYLAIGAALVTLGVVINRVTDPVNSPKLFLLGVFSVAGFFLLLSNNLRLQIQEIPIVYVLTSAFIFISVSTVLFTNSPASQNFYGVYGRNNGLLTYLLLSLVLLAATQLRNLRSFRLIIISLLVAGFGNLIYCSWALAFGDFIPWNNPYGNILGTFGNPNFIGSFFGMFTGALLTQVFNSSYSKQVRLVLLAALPILLFVTFKSNAIQGRVVAATSVAIVLFFIVREKYSTILLSAYSLFVGVVGSFALAGALQKGPLESLIYKTSVSLRGQYWAAGLNTGEEHFWTGVGFDAFGDWYRRMREARALELPGPNTVVNASHNVVIDIFAFGGLPLLISYLSLIVLVLSSSLKIIKRTKQFDPIFVSLFTVWVGYQLQSIISINQIGLAIWGWLLSGAIIGYSRVGADSPADSQSKSRNKNLRQNQSHFSPGLLAGIGMLFGALVSVPPLSADMKWRDAQISGDVKRIMSSVDSGYLNPQNTNRYLNIAIALESSNFNSEALVIVDKALDFNPESFETWRVAYFLKAATQDLKSEALQNMKRLDPQNPNVTAIN